MRHQDCQCGFFKTRIFKVVLHLNILQDLSLAFGVLTIRSAAVGLILQSYIACTSLLALLSGA